MGFRIFSGGGLTLPRNRTFRIALFAAVALHIAAAWFSVGHMHQDEYWHITDIGARALGVGGAENIPPPPQHANMIRPALPPLLAVAIGAAFNVSDPFLWAFVLRLFVAALSLASGFVFLRAFWPELKSERAQIAAVGIAALFWVLAFARMRFTEENLCASFFMLGMALWKSGRLFWAGLLLGLMFQSRYQAGILAGGFGLWLLVVRRESASGLARMLAGGAAATAAGAGLDFRLYGEWVFPAWNYFRVNILEDFIDTFQHEPPWFFAEKLGLSLPPFSLLGPIGLAGFWVMFPRHPLTWATAPFVLFHHFFAHKETRFLFPMLHLLPLMLALAWERLAELRPRLAAFFARRGFWAAALAFNIPALLAISLTPANKAVYMHQNCVQPRTAAAGRTTVLFAREPAGDAYNMFLPAYNREGVAFSPVENEAELRDRLDAGAAEGEPLFLYATRKIRTAELEEAGVSAELACAAWPDWVLALDFNGWTQRSSIWRIYEVSAR